MYKYESWAEWPRDLEYPNNGYSAIDMMNVKFGRIILETKDIGWRDELSELIRKKAAEVVVLQDSPLGKLLYNND